jgi:hypothetical protein
VYEVAELGWVFRIWTSERLADLLGQRERERGGSGFNHSACSVCVSVSPESVCVSLFFSLSFSVCDFISLFLSLSLPPTLPSSIYFGLFSSFPFFFAPSLPP